MQNKVSVNKYSSPPFLTSKWKRVTTVSVPEFLARLLGSVDVTPV